MPSVKEILDLVPVEQLSRELVPRVVTDIRFRTAFTDETVLLNAQEIIDIINGKPTPPSTASKLLAAAKPTVTVNSPMFGTRVWAPYGIADTKTPSIWKGRVGLLLGGIAFGIFAIGFATGRVTKKTK